MYFQKIAPLFYRRSGIYLAITMSNSTAVDLYEISFFLYLIKRIFMLCYLQIGLAILTLKNKIVELSISYRDLL